MMTWPTHSRVSRSSTKRPFGNSKSTTISTMRADDCGPPCNIRLLNRDTPFAKGVRIKSSTRWIDIKTHPFSGFYVPCFDVLGRFTGSFMYKWNCDPRSLITTCVSTISKRLVDYARKHNKWHVVKRFLKPILGCATYYCMTKNSHFWDRVLFFSRNLEKYGNLLHRVRLSFTSKMDDNKRFVYSQVSFQTNWLLSRALVPRDKSTFFMRVKRTIWSNPDSAPPVSSVTSCIRELAVAISSV